MINELCQELHNWFDRDQIKVCGELKIVNGKIDNEIFNNAIKVNQYFRIIGSVFNDGIYKYTNDLTLTDEVFKGSIRLMAVPDQVVDLAAEISTWLATYTDVANSPYQSESFGGYSYSKTTGKSGPVSWQSIFKSRLNQWRKI